VESHGGRDEATGLCEGVCRGLWLVSWFGGECRKSLMGEGFVMRRFGSKVRDPSVWSGCLYGERLGKGD
jgi:hypothetical protein